MKDSTRAKSSIQEKRIAKAIGGRKVVGSGSTPFLKGDVIAGALFIEAKTKMNPSQSITVKKSWIDKAKEQSLAMRKEDYAIAVSFGDPKEYYLIEDNLMEDLYKSREALGYRCYWRSRSRSIRVRECRDLQNKRADKGGILDMCKISEMNLETAKYYGYEAQSNQLVEECAELIQAVNKYRRVETGLGQPVAEDKKAIARDNLVEEIADVELMLEQVKYLLQIPEDELLAVKTFKVNRTRERMESSK